MDLNLSPKEELKTKVTKAYSCPLYADVTRDKTGRKLNLSPKEKMKLQVVELNRRPIGLALKDVVIE
jgi:hypothetical protein